MSYIGYRILTNKVIPVIEVQNRFVCASLLLADFDPLKPI